MPRILALLGMLVLVCASLNSHAYIASKSYGVYDPHEILSPLLYQRLGRLIHSSHQSADVYIHLLVVNQPQQPLEQIALMKKAQLEVEFPVLQTKSKVIYIAINVATHESMILLGKQFQPTESLYFGLQEIHKKILTPYLQNNAHEKACLESVIALMTALEDWPAVIG